MVDFKKLREAPQERIFEELCFCLLTAGAKAENCKKIILTLKENKLLFCGCRKELGPYLKYARFYDQKAQRLVEARKFFSQDKRFIVKEKVFCGDPMHVRGWLVKHVNGLGFKEASHFLRNIGLGQDFAILDRHILKRIKELGVITELPKTLTPKKYLEIEEKMRVFSKRVKIPLDHLDLLFFSVATKEPIKNCK